MLLGNVTQESPNTLVANGAGCQNRIGCQNWSRCESKVSVSTRCGGTSTEFINLFEPADFVLSSSGLLSTSEVSLDSTLYTASCFRRSITSYLPCLHNHLSKSSASSPFGTSPLAVFHLVDAPKFLCPAGFFIKFLTFRVSGLSSPSQITLDLWPLFAKTLARA